MMDNETLYAYFAGAIDADGFISVQRSVKSSEGGRIYYAARIGFTGTGEPTVQQLLKEAFGGSVYQHTPANKAHKVWHVWLAEGHQAAKALRAILPHLRNKRRQAELALELIELMGNQWDEIRATQKPPYRLTSEMIAKRDALWEAVTHLNSPRNRRVHFVTATSG